MKYKLGVIGAGRFGRAFLEGVLKSKIFKASSIWAAEKSETAQQELTRHLKVKMVTDFSAICVETEVIVLAVKPAQISTVIAGLRASKISDKALIISVAAGTSLQKIESELQLKIPVVRVMPNSPAAVQSGITAICRGTYASDKDFKLAKSIFESVGVCLEIEEKYFDLVTAISGSGPAYFYTMIHDLTEVGVEGGLTHEQALSLATHTAGGAAEMILRLKRDPQSLRSDVATPGGCTLEALKVLEANLFSQILIKAVKEATRVAGQLGKGASLS
jgi:pyrroline-5-carboxylate reductase